MKTIFHLILLTSSCIIFFTSCKKDEEPEDKTAPIITINGNNPYIVGQGTTYVDPGASAVDDKDGDITNKIIISNQVNTADTGYYYVKYNVTDNAGNAAEEKKRVVHVIITK